MPRARAPRAPVLPWLALAPFFVLALVSCRTLGLEGSAAPPEGASGAEEGARTNLPPTPVEPLPVKKVEEEIVIAAWAEPKRLPRGGGEAQLLVRVQKRGGARFPGVEVSLGASTGSLHSAGRILLTDSQGMTRDRIIASKTVTITLNAGGTRYRFQVPVGEDRR